MGQDTTDLLLRTLRDRPDFGHICRSLVIGVGEDEEMVRSDVGQRANSIALVEVLNACPNIRHLQVRALISFYHISVDVNGCE